MGLDYKLPTNILGLVVFAARFALTIRRGDTDPVCGMRVDRAKAITIRENGRASYFCSSACASTFVATGAPTASEDVTPRALQ